MSYERLTEHKKLCGIDYIKLKDCDSYDCGSCISPCEDAKERLAELEDMIESGFIIELPHKVGDRVFGIDEWILNHVGSYRAIKEGTIVYIDARILADKIIYHYSIEYFDNIFKVNDTKSRSVCFHVFTTREAAEAKLKELRGE